MKPKEQIKAIKGKSNNQSIAANILNNVVKKRKSIKNELLIWIVNESVDKNKFYFEYVGPTKDVRFYEYMNSKELFNEIKDNWLRFDDALKKQKELLKKINEVKMGKTTSEQENVITNLESLWKCREEVFDFF